MVVSRREHTYCLRRNCCQGLPVKELEGPIKRFLAGKTGKQQEAVLEATNRRGQAILCTVSQTIRCGSSGESLGVILLMEEERK